MGESKEEGRESGRGRRAIQRRGEKRWDIHWICINRKRTGRRAREQTAAADKAIQACQNPAARPVIYEDPQSRLRSESSIQQPFVHGRDPPLLHVHTPRFDQTSQTCTCTCSCTYTRKALITETDTDV